MQHDIYSLGVCLLEIGLWEHLVIYKNKDTALPGNGACPLASPASFLQDSGDSYLSKDQLLALARGKLQRRIGTRYSDAVVTCLTYLDLENEDFGDEADFQDADGIEVGVRYIEKVSTQKSS